MLNYTEAQKIVSEKARSFGREKLALENSYGRVLAEPLVADRDYPPFHRSSMDGYAIRYSDFEKGIRRYTVTEIIYAGAANTKPLLSGECYKIMTGSPVPPDADTVIRKEDTEAIADTRIQVDIRLDSCRPFQNIARRGEDIHAGDTAIDKACIIGPAVIGLLASLGKNEFTVECLPRVALFTTGNEVVPVESSVNKVQIRNSNRWLLQSLLMGWGISPFLYEHVPDSKEALRHSLAKALPGKPASAATPSFAGSSVRDNPLPADIIILSGGVSAGDADYVPGILEELGVQKLFHKITIKPGKPVWCGITPGGGMVFALPGNPFSCMVGFVLLIQHYLHACFGLPPQQKREIPLEGARKKKTLMDEFFPVRLAGSPAKLIPVDINGSGDIRLGLHADALALHPAASGDLPEGAPLAAFFFK
jgi:molybdopterin molybdotransferase